MTYLYFWICVYRTGYYHIALITNYNTHFLHFDMRRYRLLRVISWVSNCCCIVWVCVRFGVWPSSILFCKAVFSVLFWFCNEYSTFNLFLASGVSLICLEFLIGFPFSLVHRQVCTNCSVPFYRR